LPPGASTTPDKPTPVGEPIAPVQPVESGTPFRFFAPSSFWNEPLATDAPLDPSSSAMMSAFAKEVALEEQAKNGPWINTTSYSVPIYTVPVDQPTVPVALSQSTEVPALESAWSAVPLPSNAQPAAGTDAVWSSPGFVEGFSLEGLA
jgi:hypothetical protein